MVRKPGTGRRSIKMKLIPSKSCRKVTFSKRWQGFSQTAHELVSLCGGHIVLLVTSPLGKTGCTFGSPSMTQALERFENLRPQAGGAAVLNGQIETA